ncbi:MAG TPA: ATP-grasp domain-containing protein [Oligoflexia bacterium]|nr:ATP-grasp domain-containing protein [Oligoflexia bacterium]HMR23835.1 ATP-grasp domain-containing protein [Oligoflexia bacterium]
MEKKPLNILITAISGNSYGAQVAKSLSLMNKYYNIFGVDASSNIFMHPKIKLSAFKQVPLASDPNYINTIIEIYKNFNIDYLIDGSEPEQQQLNTNREKLIKNSIQWISNSEKVLKTCSNKLLLSEFLLNNGFYTPKTFKNLDSINDSDFPLILKPYQGSGGSKHTYIVQNFDDIQATLTLSKIDPSLFYIQQYVGSWEQEFTVGVLHSAKKQLLGAVTLHRNLSNPLSVKTSVDNMSSKQELGNALKISSGFSQGILMDHQEIQKQCIKIAQTLESSCALNFQGRWINGKFYIFEINPRFSGTSYFRALHNMNEAHMWINNQQNPTDHSNIFQLKQESQCTRYIVEHISK